MRRALTFQWDETKTKEEIARKKPNEWNFSVEMEQLSLSPSTPPSLTRNIWHIMENRSVDEMVRFGVSATASRQISVHVILIKIEIQ